MNATKPKPKRVAVVGTRAVLQFGPSDFRVVCATCDRGTVRYTTSAAALSAATINSGRPCHACGAR